MKNQKSSKSAASPINSTPAPVKASRAPRGNLIVESAVIGPDGKLVIICNPRASRFIEGTVWIHTEGDLMEWSGGWFEAGLKADLTSSGQRAMFKELATAQSVAA